MLVGVYWTDVEDWYLEWLNGGLVWKGENFFSLLFRYDSIPIFVPCASQLLIGPRYEKTCLPGFRQSDIQNSLLSYRDKLEHLNLACRMSRHYTFR